MSTVIPNSSDARAAFILRGLGVRFPGTERPVLENVSLTVKRGEFLSLVGPSGCGKSTILKILAGLLSPTEGSIADSVSATGAKSRIGFVFQHPTLLPWRTAEANLRLPHELGCPALRPELSRADCRSLLIQVGLSVSDVGKRPAELSGGMQMRLSLARALATQPDVLLLDEPFAAVDDLLRLRLQEDVRKLHDTRQLTTILVTHNVSEAVFLSDRVIVLNGSPSRIVADICVPSSVARSSAYRDSLELFSHITTVNAALFRIPGPEHRVPV